MVNTEVKKVNKEFKLLVLVVVRTSSIVKLETVPRGWYWGTLYISITLRGIVGIWNLLFL